jgi:hypothetical protein
MSTDILMGEEPAELPVRLGLRTREEGWTLRLGMRSPAAIALCDAACFAKRTGHAPRSPSGASDTHYTSGGSGVTNRDVGLPAI